MGETDRLAVTQGRLTLIDGLRGFAAMAVLFYHFTHFSMTGADHGLYLSQKLDRPLGWLFAPLFDHGTYAVQLFWMISGFVFAAVYFARPSSTREFWVNRFARLYPLHVVTLLVVAALQGWALARFGHTLIYDNYDWPHFAGQLVLAADWLVGSGFSFNGPIWSVSVEIVVYAMFWILRDRLARMGPLAWAGLLAACYLSTALADYSRIPFCALYFFCGAALLRGVRAWQDSPARLWTLAAVLLAIGLAGLADGSAIWRMTFAIPGLGLALILALALLEPYASPRLRAAAEWLGDCSYGIYLWHIPLQLALMLLLLPDTRPASITAQPWFLPVWILGVTFWARLSFVGFERPAREAIRLFNRNRAALPRGGPDQARV